MADTFFYAPNFFDTHQLDEQESQHCVKVLRMKEGEVLTVGDGIGHFYTCELVEAHPKHCLLNILDTKTIDKNRDYNIEIAFAPTKQMERNEWFVEKAVELGIDTFSPLKCFYSERKEIKIDRLTKVMVSALKQSQQAYLPQLNEMTAFDSFIKQPFDEQKFIAHCYPSAKKELTKICNKKTNTLILIGPEGDFSREEIDLAMKNGCEAISLGNNRLRTETACLAALHTVHVINSM